MAAPEGDAGCQAFGARCVLNGKERRSVVRAGQIKRGNVIKWRDQLWKVVDTQQTFVGKKGAYFQMKLQSMDGGRTVTERFNSGQQVEKAFLETRRVQYLYQDGSSYVFMDPGTGDQIHIPEDALGEALPYLAYNAQVEVRLHEGKTVSVELPASVVLEVTRTEPAVRGDTAATVTKPAEVETGLSVKVPGHIKVGDRIQVDTRTGQFLGRA